MDNRQSPGQSTFVFPPLLWLHVGFCGTPGKTSDRIPKLVRRTVFLESRGKAPALKVRPNTPSRRKKNRPRGPGCRGNIPLGVHFRCAAISTRRALIPIVEIYHFPRSRLPACMLAQGAQVPSPAPSAWRKTKDRLPERAPMQDRGDAHGAERPAVPSSMVLVGTPFPPDHVVVHVLSAAGVGNHWQRPSIKYSSRLWRCFRDVFS